MAPITPGDPIASAILANLNNQADARGFVCVDVTALSQLVDCAPSAVQKALRRLAAAGQIEPAAPGSLPRVCLAVGPLACRGDSA